MRLRAAFRSAAAAVFMLSLNCSCLAATPDAAEARALLDKAVAYFDSNGVARAFCAFNDADGAFHKGPLYVFAINMDGVYFAHSAAPTLIGTSLRDTRDAAGQPIANLVMEAVAAQQSAPVEYMWLNYETNKVKETDFSEEGGKFHSRCGLLHTVTSKRPWWFPSWQPLFDLYVHVCLGGLLLVVHLNCRR